jgi:predicted CoA-binding protein
VKHMTRGEANARHVLQRARTIAIVGASPREERHSNAVVEYLKTAGYDVVPVHPDGGKIAGVGAYRRLADIPGSIDLVVIFRRPEAVPAHVEEAAAKHVDTVWLQPGCWSLDAERAAKRSGVTLVKESCVAEEHRHLAGPSGHPRKWGVHVSRRKAVYEDNRRRPDTAGYTAEGGGGHSAGGGVRSVLDEKKMVKGAPSRRRGPMKPKPL